MDYWVYENTIHQKTRVHTSTCPFCQDGRGLHGAGETESGRWFGPFASTESARERALNCNQPDNRTCLQCLPDERGIKRTSADNKVVSADKSVDPVCEVPSWDGSNEQSGSLRIKWTPIGRVTLDLTGKCKFPAPPDGAGLYRFRFRKTDGTEALYVGESDNLRRRFGNYRNPGPTQATSLRINHAIVKHLKSGGEISVAISFESAWIQWDQSEMVADFSRKSVRRLFENFVLSAEKAADIEDLNR
jgi:GIY-YIG catalytic domain